MHRNFALTVAEHHLVGEGACVFQLAVTCCIDAATFRKSCSSMLTSTLLLCPVILSPSGKAWAGKGISIPGPVPLR